MQNVKIISLFLSSLIFMFCVSCGVSSSSSASSPTSAHSPSADDPTQNYFKFVTDSLNYSSYGDAYKGTEIYYKIYTSVSVLINEHDNIASSTSGATAKSKFDSLNYKLLNGAQYIIPPSKFNQTVEIRLIDETSYVKGIKIDGSLFALPTRYTGGKSFQFSSTDFPKVSDLDFNGTETSVGPWYVAAYAVSVLVNLSDSPPTSYSLPKYLGYVKVYY
ncbi:MAG: hypothetical protein GX297_04815 [Treponema sp.]|nr:hypothetical protein [Treponema sp.]